MSDAPERIWADTEGRWTTFDASENRRDPCVKYSRTDLIQPMIDKAVAEALEWAAKICEEQEKDFLSEQYAVGQPLSSFKERFACQTCAKEIRALIPPALVKRKPE